MINFHAMRELLGESLWQRAKAKIALRGRIQLYEKLSYQPFYPKEFIGDSSDFCLGYIETYKKSRIKRDRDMARARKLKELESLLSS